MFYRFLYFGQILATLLTLLHSERPKLHAILAFLSAIRLKSAAVFSLAAALASASTLALLVQQGCHRSGENTWKMKLFPGQGKVRAFCGWSGSE